MLPPFTPIPLVLPSPRTTTAETKATLQPKANAKAKTKGQLSTQQPQSHLSKPKQKHYSLSPWLLETFDQI